MPKHSKEGTAAIHRPVMRLPCNAHFLNAM